METNQSLSKIEEPKQNLVPVNVSSKKKFICIGIGVSILVVIIVVAIAVPLALRKKKIVPCQGDSSVCEGIDAKVIDFVSQNYQNTTQANAVLEYAQVVSRLNNSNSGYNDLFLKAQCLNFIFGDQDYLDHFDALQGKLVEAGLLDTLVSITLRNEGQIASVHSTAELQVLCNASSQNSRILQQQSTNSTSCTAHNQTFYFAAGVGYSVDGSLQVLKTAQRIFQPDPNTQFSYKIYGPEKAQITQIQHLLEIYKQKIKQADRNSVISQRNISLIVQTMMHMVSKGRSSTWMFDIYTQLLQIRANHLIGQFQIDAQTIYNINSTNRILLDQLKQEFSQGRKIILVAHSQGTLYANEAYDELNATQKQYVGMVFIGAAASEMKGPFPQRYITNPADLAISTLRTSAMILNFSNPLPVKSSTVSHEWDRVLNNDASDYMRSYPEFAEYVKQAQHNAVQPQSMLGDGPITVELTWDEKPDVDLHIIQPTGTHVYHYFKTGEVGVLDLDDRDKYGPQHYYTKCELIIPGTFIVGVNYYKGNGSTQALMRVSAGTEFFYKQLNLSQAAGVLGDQSPIKVCQIVVTRLGNNLFDYTIR